MSDWYTEIDDERRTFIEAQHLFFVATAPQDSDAGFPNLSPKGRSLLRVLGANLVGYVDYPGSGNETANHLEEGSNITLMLCSFGPTAGILRLYGKGRRLDLDDPEFRQYAPSFAEDLHPYVRQVFLVDVEKLQTSCGYAVPRYELIEERETLDKWCERKLQPREVEGGLPKAGPLLTKEGALYGAQVLKTS